MTVLVALDTETGLVRRYEGKIATHVAGLTNDPEDALKTASVIEGFRLNPHMDHAIKVPRPRTMEDALREQRIARAEAEQRGRA